MGNPKPQTLNCRAHKLDPKPRSMRSSTAGLWQVRPQHLHFLTLGSTNHYTLNPQLCGALLALCESESLHPELTTLSPQAVIPGNRPAPKAGSRKERLVSEIWTSCRRDLSESLWWGSDNLLVGRCVSGRATHLSTFVP